MRVKINLDTEPSVRNLVGIATRINEKITVTDNNGLVVNAKSILGVLYAKMEFNELWLECENDHYFAFKDFIAGD